MFLKNMSKSITNDFKTSLQISASRSPNSSPNLHTIRHELLKLEPPKWTKQQQPKRVFKSEEKYNSISNTVTVRYTKNQVNILNTHFLINQHPSSNEFHRIARVTALDHYQVKKWFQNRRAKERKALK